MNRMTSHYCRNHIKPQFIVAIIGAFQAANLFSGVALALDLSLSLQAGLDTNPNRLASRHDPDTELFSLAKIKIGNDFENGAFVKFRGSQAIYFDNEDADWDKTKLELGYRSEFEAGQNKYDYELSIDNRVRDKTYVSRVTGEEATDAGQPIGDRYDYDSTNLNASISFKTEQKSKFKFSYQLRQRDYENFSIPGLSNIDYDHDRFRIDSEFRLSDTSRLRAGLGTTDREFDDKRISDLNGTEIAGTDLKYDTLDYSVEYINRFNQANRLKLKLLVQDRDDNGAGYKDSNYDSLTLSNRLKLEQDKRLLLSLKYSDFSYDNRTVSSSDSLDEEDFDSKGYVFTVDYRKPWSLTEREIELQMVLEYTDFDSTDPDYRYDGIAVFAGIRIDLY